MIPVDETRVSPRTLSVLVLDQPGVLARVSGLFSRRGFNIDSLAVGPTESEGVSRITLVARCDDHVLEQLTKQLHKLIDVLKIVELDDRAVQRELAMIKVSTAGGARSQVLEIVQLFRVKAVDVSPETITIEATGDSGKLEALLVMLRPFGIRELVQSGVVALARGTDSLADRGRLRPTG